MPQDFLHHRRLADQGNHAHDILAHRAAERIGVPADARTTRWEPGTAVGDFRAQGVNPLDFIRDAGVGSFGTDET